MWDKRIRKIAITGGTGFIGSSVVKILLERGIEISALVEKHQSPIANCTSFVGDVNDYDTVVRTISNSELVIHLAGPASVAQSFESATHFLNVHVVGTATVMEACRSAKISKVVYISSAEVYGRPDSNSVSEEDYLQSRSPYAASKIGAEKVIEAFVHTHGFNAVILRPFSVYGPDSPPGSLLATILSQAGTRNAIKLRDLKPIRDYCYVEDVAEGIVNACMYAREGLAVFNLGTGVGTSVADFSRIIITTLGTNQQIEEDVLPKRPSNAEIPHLIANTRKSGELLGWRPRSVREGVRDTLSKMGKL